MPFIHRLLKIGSMAESMGVYVSATVVQKFLGAARIFIFMYLFGQRTEQLGLWGIGVLIFAFGPLLTLGSNHSLARYVSFYEARGQLAEFYRRIRWFVLFLAMALAAIAFAFSDEITKWVIVSRAQDAMADFETQKLLCLLALANALALALYVNMLGFMAGMRVYRLISSIEVCFVVLFTALSAVMLISSPTAIALLSAHLIAMAISIIAGSFLLHLAVSHYKEVVTSQTITDEKIIVEPKVEGDDVSSTASLAAFEPADVPQKIGKLYGRILSYGLVSNVGQLMLFGVIYLSFFLTHRQLGEDQAGIFYPWLILCQNLMLLANPVLNVVFTYVARKWEDRQRNEALDILETSFKAVAIIISTLGVLAYLSSPWWVRLLESSYRLGLPLLGGLILFFLMMLNLSFVNIVAKLREQPIYIGITAFLAGALNLILALWWMKEFEYGPEGAAWAAGVSMFVVGCLASFIYLPSCKIKLHSGTYFVLMAPVLILIAKWLPGYVLGLCWLVVLGLVLFTPLVFKASQKQIILEFVRNIFKRKKR